MGWRAATSERPVLEGLGLAVTKVSFPFYLKYIMKFSHKIPERVHRQGRKVYYCSQYWRFQLIVTWPHCFGPVIKGSS